MIKHLDKFLAVKLKDDLEEIESRLRVSTKMEAVLRALEKEFGLCANYPKGHCNDFVPLDVSQIPRRISFSLDTRFRVKATFCV